MFKGKPYAELRKRLICEDITGPIAAEIIGVSATTFSHRLNNQSPWQLHEVYTLLEAIGASPSEAPLLFPVNDAKTNIRQYGSRTKSKTARKSGRYT